MQPDLILTPFGNDAEPGTIRVIPESKSPSDDKQDASWETGFPAVTMTAISAGGVPPEGPDMNGVLNAISQHTAFIGGGGQYKWSDVYVAAKGGYSKGAVIQADTGDFSYVSAIDENTINFNNDPSSIGAQWKHYSGPEIAAQQLEERLSGSSGAEMVGVISPLAGAVSSNMALFGRDFTNIRTVFGAVGDGVYRPLSEFFGSLAEAQMQYASVPITTLAESIDYVAGQCALNSGRLVWVPPGKFVLTRGYVIPDGGGLSCAGFPRYTPYAPSLVKTEGGTQFLMYGDGDRTHTVAHVTNCDTSGGVLANPAANDPYTAFAPVPFYSLHDFSNGDAVGSTPATLKKFNAAISCAEGSRIALSNFRVIPWNGPTGQENYQSNLSVDLGARWDVGIWLRNSSGSYIDNIQAVGYWRIAAVLKTTVSENGAIAQGESDNLTNITMQGYAGFMSRAYDLHRVIGVTANTITIPWSASHQFGPTGTVRVDAADRAYASLTFSSGSLTFNGINTAGVTTASELRVAGGSFGASGTTLNDCYINSLGHHSFLSATSPLLKESDGSQAWLFPSTAIEISGEPNRAFMFGKCTVISNDDRIAHLHHARDIKFDGTYWEAKSSRSALGSGANTIPPGCRFIASRQSANIVPNPAGYTGGLKFMDHTDGLQVDFRPIYNFYPSEKYLTGGGLFNPREVQIDKFNMPTLSGGDMSIRSPTKTDFRNADNTETWAVISSGGIIPGKIDQALGASVTAQRWGTVYANAINLGGAIILSGQGTPQGVVTAARGSLYIDLLNGDLYKKKSGFGNTGWVLMGEAI